jgi:hypothetical protein
MKKLPVLVTTCVLGLWGCASSSNRPGGYVNYQSDVEQARMARMESPTVYNGEATGGPGYTVTTGDGRIWAPEEAPGNTVLRSQQYYVWVDSEDQNGFSEVIDEGPTPPERASR